MTNWIEFGRGPLFRLCFVLMVLGLARILILTLVGVHEAYRRNPDKIVNWKEVRHQTFAWLFPDRSFMQAAALLQSAFFCLSRGHDHHSAFPGIARAAVAERGGIRLACHSAGLGELAHVAGDFNGSGPVSGAGCWIVPPASSAGPRTCSGHCSLPFLSSPVIVASNAAIGPRAYQELMLIHIYAGDLIMLMIPFTKIAHCVLMPLSQLVTAVAWKFPAGAGDRVAETLGFSDRPTWVPKARLSSGLGASEPAVKGGAKK